MRGGGEEGDTALGVDTYRSDSGISEETTIGRLELQSMVRTAAFCCGIIQYVYAPVYKRGCTMDTMERSGTAVESPQMPSQMRTLLLVWAMAVSES